MKNWYFTPRASGSASLWLRKGLHPTHYGWKTAWKNVQTLKRSLISSGLRRSPMFTLYNDLGNPVPRKASACCLHSSVLAKRSSLPSQKWSLFCTIKTRESYGELPGGFGSSSHCSLAIASLCSHVDALPGSGSLHPKGFAWVLQQSQTGLWGPAYASLGLWKLPLSPQFLEDPDALPHSADLNINK